MPQLEAKQTRVYPQEYTITVPAEDETSVPTTIVVNGNAARQVADVIADLLNNIHTEPQPEQPAQ